MGPRVGRYAVALGAAVVLALSARAGWAGAPIGPTIEVGAPTSSGGTIQVPILTSGSGFAAYEGFQIHLRWDPALFAFRSADSAGGLFAASSGHALCVGPVTNTYDSDGGGMFMGCALIGGTSVAQAGPGITTTGLLLTVSLTPKGSGCSPLHLTTLGAPDNAGAGSGSFTNSNDAAAEPQANTYVDGTADTSGGPCQAGGATVQAGTTPSSQPPNATVPVEVPTNVVPLPANTAAVTPGGIASAASGSAIRGVPTGAVDSRATGTAQPTVIAAATAGAAKTAAISAGGSRSSSSGGSGARTAAIVAGVIVAAAMGGGGYLFLRRRRGA